LHNKTFLKDNSTIFMIARSQTILIFNSSLNSKHWLLMEVSEFGQKPRVFKCSELFT